MWQDELSQKSYVEPDVYFISILYDDILVKAIKMQKVAEVEYLVLDFCIICSAFWGTEKLDQRHYSSL